MLVSRTLLLNWAAVQFCVILLLQQALSLWFTVTLSLLLVFRVYAVWNSKPAVSLRLTNLLAAVIVVLLLVNLRQAGVLYFMLQILLLSAVSRLLAIHQPTDARQLIWVQYFLIGCSFILHQDMLIALFIFALLLVNLYCHYRLFAPSSVAWRYYLPVRSAILLLPLWLGLFFLFPRLPPFWQIPQSNTASTGLSNTLDPGSIEKLAQSDELAFRVSFNNAIPPRHQLYWRAMLYEQFDGRSWKVHPQRERVAQSFPYPQPTLAGSVLQEQYSYKVIAEISHQQNLYALGHPDSVTGDISIAASGLIRSRRPVSQRLSYQVVSSLQPVPMLSDFELQANLDIGTGNPQTLAFAEQLRKQYTKPDQLVAALAEHFRQQPFYYSLTPPLLGMNSVDQFLFQTRTGFCGHYASATALIFRAAGIPARVVGGYQGGTWHSEQGYLAVRQREAHAWIEYATDGHWVRFDPTAAVAPERVLQNLEDILSPQQQQLLNNGWRQIAWFQTLRQQFLHLDYYWSVWVLGFDHTDQRQLWQQLKQQAVLIVYLFAAVICLIVLGTTFVLLRRRNPGYDTHPAYRLLNRYFRPLLNAKPPHKSISDYLEYLAAVAPEHASWLNQLKLNYERAVFGDNQQAVSHLRRLLQQNRPALRRLRRTIENA